MIRLAYYIIKVRAVTHVFNLSGVIMVNFKALDINCVNSVL